MRRLLAALAFCAAFFCAGTLHARATASPTVFSGTISAACVTFSGCPTGTVVPATLPLVPSIVTVQVAGTFSGTIQFEGSIDCQNGWPVQLAQNGVGAVATNTIGPGLWSATVFYVSCFQVRASQWSSGTAKISISATPLTGGTSLTSGGGSGGGTQNVICISGCSGLAPLPGSGGTPVTANQSVGLQGLSADGTQMLPWQFDSTNGLPVHPIIGATPFPVTTSPPNSAAAPLPGNASTTAGASQNTGVSFNDGAGHMVPVSPTSPLPDVTPNPSPTCAHGALCVEGTANGTAVNTAPTFNCSTGNGTINALCYDQTDTVSLASATTGSTTFTLIPGVNSKSTYVGYSGVQTGATAPTGSPTYQFGWYNGLTCPSNGVGVVYELPFAQNVPAGVGGLSTAFSVSTNANALAGGFTLSPIPDIAPGNNNSYSYCVTIAYTGSGTNTVSAVAKFFQR